MSSTKKSSSSLVIERIDLLFSKAAKSSPAEARRYVEMAVSNATRHNVPVPGIYKMLYCPKCFAYLKPGSSSVRASTKQASVIVRCLGCGHVMRFPYRKEKTAQKAAQKA